MQACFLKSKAMDMGCLTIMVYFLALKRLINLFLTLSSTFKYNNYAIPKIIIKYKIYKITVNLK